MARVFVSHAGGDSALAAKMHRWLASEGHEVFLDRDLHDGISVGEDWEQRLHERLRWADAVLCLVTTSYLSSTWCSAEVAIARARGSRVLPVRAEAGLAHPLLKSVQHVDLIKDETAAQERLTEVLRRTDAAGGFGWPDDRSPFPGLRAFEADQHRVFFGRGVEVSELAGLLRSPAEHAAGAVLLVVGPSGCGKSSLVRAGLLPAMAEEPGWLALAPIVPGMDPTSELARELAFSGKRLDLGWTVADVRSRLDDGAMRELIDELIVAGPASCRRLLVVIDQFEELVTQTPPDRRARFAEILRPALGGQIRVVATLRPEFLEPLLLDSELHSIRTNTYTVRPLRREMLAAVVEQPARLAGIEIDDGLVERLVGDTHSGDALPLLAYTLAQLADGVGRGGRLLLSRYEQIGGVAGTLSRQADTALTEALEATGGDDAEVIRALLRLVTVDEQGRPTRRRVRRAELPDVTAARLAPFLFRRLLTTDTADGGAVLEVAHEAFLSAWAPLAQAITADTKALRARRDVEAAADEWVRAERPPRRLWERGQLAAAVEDTGARIGPAGRPGATPAVRAWRPWRQVPLVLSSARVDFSPQARDFLTTSIRRDRTRRNRTTMILSALLVTAVAVAGFAVVSQRHATAQQGIAIARQLRAQAEAARASDLRAALLLGEAAQYLHPGPESQSSLVETLAITRYESSLTGHHGWVNKVAFAPNGHTMATASYDQTAALWDVQDPTRPRRIGQPLTGHTGRVMSLAFAPDGRTLATAGLDKLVIVWDVQDPAHPRRLGEPLTGHTGPIWSLAFAPDGRTLATAGLDKLVIVWDVQDPAHPRRLGEPLTDHAEPVFAVAFAPDSRTLATTSPDDGTVILWDVHEPAQVRRLGEALPDGGKVMSLMFAPDGHTLATGGYDKTIGLWDVRNPSRPHRIGDPLTGHTSAVFSVAFTPDSSTLASAGDDSTPLLWDVRDPTRPHRIGDPLTGHAGPVQSVAFSPDGRTLATASRDQSVSLWEVGRLGPTQPLSDFSGHTEPIGSVAITPDGRTLATASWDKTALLWDITDPRQPQRLGEPLTGHSEAIGSVAVTRDGRTLATASWDKTALLWDITDPRQPQRLGEPLTGHSGAINAVAISPDGRTMATASMDKTAVLWDISDARQPHRLGEPLTHAYEVTSLAFSPDGLSLVSGDLGGAVLWWDVRDPGRALQLGDPLTGHTDGVASLVFTPDGRTLGTGSFDRSVLLWDVTDRTRPRRFDQLLTGHRAPVSGVAFSPDGLTMATTSGDQTTVVWDVSAPNQPRRLGKALTGHESPVSAAAFTPDGRTLVTVGWDEKARLWDITGVASLRENTRQRACLITNGGLTPEQWSRYVSGLEYEDPCAS